MKKLITTFVLVSACFFGCHKTDLYISAPLGGPIARISAIDRHLDARERELLTRIYFADLQLISFGKRKSKRPIAITAREAVNEK